MRFKNISLADFRGGIGAEMLDEAMQKALDNIENPNTWAGAAREVTLTVRLSPNRNREVSIVTVGIEADLAREFCEPPKRKYDVSFLRGDREDAHSHSVYVLKKYGGPIKFYSTEAEAVKEMTRREALDDD